MQLKRNLSRLSFEYLLPVFTGFLYAVAIKYFIRPTSVIVTGTEGISLATSYYLHSEIVFVVMYSCFQFLLLIFSFLKIGFSFSIKTLITVISVSCFILILPMIRFGSPEPENERLVLVIFGAIITGLAKALSFKNRGSTGDEDIIAIYISEKLRKPVGRTIILSGIISTTYGLILAYLETKSVSVIANTLIYTTIFIFISSQTVNNIYKRFKYSQITINVDDTELVGNIIKSILPESSFTVSDVRGGFSGGSRKQITLILSQEELPLLLNAFKDIGNRCFIHYSQVDGVAGRFPLRPTLQPPPSPSKRPLRGFSYADARGRKQRKTLQGSA